MLLGEGDFFYFLFFYSYCKLVYRLWQKFWGYKLFKETYITL
jgi:hypothetical protein